MQTNFYSQGSYNNMSFSMKTSSGDEINFSMYDNKSLEYSSAKSPNASAQSLTLRHEYGYNFSYKGNGLDEKDMAELDEALKQIRPQIDEFMKNVKNGDKIAGTNESITNLANSIRSQLPQPNDIDHKNFINDNMLKLFDELLAQNEANKNLLIATKKLFDTILDDTNKISYYA
ncbi:hypothetical protein [Campylobacter curvus]|uniref:hypothetical protein n=1 Tax=Campylobacter curvus TaxID=200 RepID=UPI00036865C7|nr:hypothetical protein [Campylobacter curvus]QKF60651.1 hypothetical protein CCVT_0335 [Campylobacter curvus]UEB48976.1 ATP/GTP-binding protein [Campylobacter curvus]